MQQPSAEVKLQKVQRLTCLEITEAMPTYPIAEVMLNLSPLYMCIMKKAAVNTSWIYLAEEDFIPRKFMSKPADIMST